MQKVLIIGNSGSGKTTLARILSKKLNLPIIHLDQYFWNPGWRPTEKQLWEKKSQRASREESMDNGWELLFYI